MATPKTFTELFMDRAASGGAQDALVDNDGTKFIRLTWAGYRDQASAVAMGLRALGIDHGDVVALMMGNRNEHVVADVGVMLAGATPFSVYNTFTAEQVLYIANDAGAKVAIVENASYRDVWLEIADRLPNLEHIIVVEAADATGKKVSSWDDLLINGQKNLEANPGEFDNAWRSVKPDDTCTLIYTSGTTGPPKGVVLTHENFMFTTSNVEEIITLQKGQVGLSYLPLAHVAERLATHYTGIFAQGTIYFSREIAGVRDVLVEARPHMFMAVPRVWEKFHAALLGTINAEPNANKKKLALAAIATGKEVAHKTQAGEPIGLALKLKYAAFDKIVLSKIREKMGLDRLTYALSGAAPISKDLLEFFSGIGISILEVYGMTETSGVITANQPSKTRFGTVGVAAPHTELKIAEDGEILSRGKHITPGYLNRPEATEESIDADGWLHTGDLGELSADGFLKIIGRKKELIITAGGKNLSPNNIEESIKQKSVLIGQMCALGDAQPFIGALIVLDAEAAPVWAAANGITFSDLASLAKEPKVIAEIKRAVDEGNKELAKVEQVREYRILPAEWTPESGELTPSMKLKRNVILDNCAAEIADIYSTVKRA
jgi:long-chain acyl-CoA synthetase